MRKLTTKIVAGALSALMMFSPLTAMAANSEEYVKEVYVSTAKNASTAKDYLTQNGYTVLDNNLNDGTGKKAVYIGYKTTKNVKEAITDLKVMDMNGGYSQANYETVINNEKNAIADNVKDIKALADEYKKNYRANAPLAKLAYKNLNDFKDQKESSSANLKCDEGKTDMLMGDYFLDDGVTSDNLTTLLLQGNGKILESLYQNLALGIYAEDEKSILEKFAEVDPDAEYSSKLDGTAKKIVACWEIMYDGLKEYEDSDVKITDGEDAVNEYLETLDDVKKVDYINYGSLYETLAEIEFGSGTMLDYFMQRSIRTKDAYPLASVFTPAQVIAMPHVGLANILTLSGNKEISNESETVIDDLTQAAVGDKESSTTSVYTDVDQNLFNGNVALTSQALAYQNASGDSPWYKANVNYYITLGAYITTGLAVGVAAFSGVMYFIKSSQIASSIDSLKNVYDTSKSAFDAAKAGMDSAMSQFNIAVHYKDSGLYSVDDIKALSTVFDAKYSEYKNAKSIMDANYNAYQSAMEGSASAWGWTAIAATGIALLAQGVYYGVKLYNYYHPDYLQIPQIICDERTTADDDGDITQSYVYYYAAGQHIDGDKKGEYGEYADLNGFTGKQWNALYTTTDLNAGNPVLASSISVKVGDNTVGTDETALSLFQTNANYNINSHQYSDKKNGIYITFKGDANARVNSTASVFTSGKVAIIAGVSAAVGIIIGTACVTISKKSKKSKEITTNN